MRANLKELPKRENRAAYLQRTVGGMWSSNCRLERHYYTPEHNPYRIATRIVKAYVNKSFNEAFSYYCSKVDKRYQHIFKEEFSEGRYYWRRRWDHFIVDDQGIIRFVKAKRPKVVYSVRDVEHGWPYRYFEFEQKDYRYYRCFYEQEAKRRKLEREAKLARKEKAYSFLTREEEKRIIDKAVNDNKILSHGFDPVTSFRNEKEGS